MTAMAERIRAGQRRPPDTQPADQVPVGGGCDPAGAPKVPRMLPMPPITVAYASALVLLGVGAWLGSGRASWTALIPAFLGLPVLLAGLLAMARPGARKHAMHVAVLFGVLGVAGTASSLPKVFALLGGAEVARPQAVVVQAITCVLSLVFVALCVASFIQARRQRRLSAAPA